MIRFYKSVTYQYIAHSEDKNCLIEIFFSCVCVCVCVYVLVLVEIIVIIVSCGENKVKCL